MFLNDILKIFRKKIVVPDSKSSNIKSEKSFIRKEPVIVKNEREYRELLETVIINVDLRFMNTEYIDIQNINLNGVGLKIYLENIKLPVLETNSDYYLIDLTNSDLRGNTIIGDISNRVELLSGQKYMYLYNEDTFDENYKNTYPEFFLETDAPLELKELFYKGYRNVETSFIGEYASEIISFPNYKRSILTYETYIKYFYYLHGKYLDRFESSSLDLGKIKLVEALGPICASRIIEEIHLKGIAANLFLKSIASLTIEEIRGLLIYEDTKEDVIATQTFIDSLKKLNKEKVKNLMNNK